MEVRILCKGCPPHSLGWASHGFPASLCPVPPPAAFPVPISQGRPYLRASGPRGQHSKASTHPCTGLSALKMVQTLFLLSLRHDWDGRRDLCQPKLGLGSHCERPEFGNANPGNAFPFYLCELVNNSGNGP